MLMRNINESLLKTEEEREEFNRVIGKFFAAFEEALATEDQTSEVVTLACFNFGLSIVAGTVVE